MSDLISRQAAIDEIDEWIKAFLENGHKESAADARLIQDGIIQLPSAHTERCADCENLSKTQLLIPQPEQKWIPCSERLPSEDGEYLVTRYAGYLPKKIIIDIAIYCRIRREWQKAYPVIAWMPLPEPYKGEQECTKKI